MDLTCESPWLRPQKRRRVSLCSLGGRKKKTAEKTKSFSLSALSGLKNINMSLFFPLFPPSASLTTAPAYKYWLIWSFSRLEVKASFWVSKKYLCDAGGPPPSPHSLQTPHGASLTRSARKCAGAPCPSVITHPILKIAGWGGGNK